MRLLCPKTPRQTRSFRFSWPSARQTCISYFVCSLWASSSDVAWETSLLLLIALRSIGSRAGLRMHWTQLPTTSWKRNSLRKFQVKISWVWLGLLWRHTPKFANWQISTIRNYGNISTSLPPSIYNCFQHSNGKGRGERLFIKHLWGLEGEVKSGNRPLWDRYWTNRFCREGGCSHSTVIGGVTAEIGQVNWGYPIDTHKYGAEADRSWHQSLVEGSWRTGMQYQTGSG
jgi:hypothetical protein